MPARGLVRLIAETRSLLMFLIVIGLFAAQANAGALVPAPNWTNELFQAEAWNGVAVDSAGDINRDGFDDVIVGAKYYDSPSTSAGLARVFYGSATGLSSTPAWGVSGPGGTGAEFGTAVAGAGDVNGDGFADVLVSALGEDLTCCYNYQGAVYLYLGTATGLSTSAARSYGPGGQGFIYFGQQLTALGDVNRDGFADFAVGSKGYSNGQSSEGAVFIYYGAATPPSAPSLIIEGNASNAGLGWVGRAGDVNGDTYPDVIVRGGNRVQIHYGSAAGLSATASWTADPSAIEIQNFSPVAGAGDVNNDGYDDILVSDFVSATSLGRVHLYLGSASGPATTPAMTFVSPLPAVGYGNGIAGIGDVDGDGYDDVVIAANGWSNGQSGEGRAFLHRGGPSGLSPTYAWTAESNSAGGNLGVVARAGDINHDGLADVILGAPQYANHGATFAYFGTSASCTPPAAPPTLAVTATANGELTLNWTTVGAAHHYIIYRALAACGAGTYTRLTETETNIGTYVDRTALPGGLYSYIVTAATAANTCESAPSPCDDETVTGTCTAKPVFAGLQSVTQTDCGLVLSWTPATSGCPVAGNIRYHVYRDTSSTFTPSSFNRIASCVSGSSFTAQMGIGGDYFIVRAEENGCAAANEETNLVRKSGTTLLSYFDNLENPRTTTKDAYWATTGPVTRTNCKAYSGTYAYRFAGGGFCNSYNAFEEGTLVLGGNGSFDPNINGFRIPQAWNNVTLTFRNYYDTVAGRDGALLQYSTMSASGPWDNVPSSPAAGIPYITIGGYNGTILGGTVPAWTGTNSSFGGVTVNLDALAGQKVWFRWMWKTGGSSSANWGYYVDDVQITGVSTTLQSVNIATPGPTTFCTSGGGSVVTATPNGGGPPWVYDWGYRTTPGGPVTTVSSFHQKTHTLWGSQFPDAGTYYVVAMVTPYCGNTTISNELPVTITASPATPAITASGPTTFCEGSSVTLTAPSGYSYLWSPGGATTQSIVVTQSGSYTVRVSSGSGCEATSAPTVVTVNPNPTVDINVMQIYDGGSGAIAAQNGDSYEICGNPTIRLVPTVLDAANGYHWSTGATTAVLDVTTSGTYALTMTDASGCTATSSVTLNFTAYPAKPAITASATELCPTGGSVTLTAPDAANWLWSTGETTRSIVVTQPGSYTVRVRDGLCESPDSDPVVITHRSVTISADGPLTFCHPNSRVLTASPASSYQWSTGATSQSIVVWDAGTYSVTATFADGCAVTSAPVELRKITASITSDRTAVCPGGSIQFNSTVAGGIDFTYQWYDQTYQPIPGATSPQLTFAPSQSGFVYLKVTDSAAACETNSNAILVTVEPPLDAAITAPASVCASGGGTASVADAGPNAIYQWSITNGTIQPSGRTAWFAPSGTDAMTISVTVSNPGCSATSTANIAVTPLPTAAISASGPMTFCEDGSVTLSAPAGYSYVWNTGATTQSIVVTTSGSYGVTVTDGAGCSATSAPANVNVNALPAVPAVTPSGATTFCEGGSVTLSAPNGYTYQWSNGATTQSINVTTSGNYSVTITNANGCSTTSTATTVTVNALPAVPAISANGPTALCPGSTVRLSAPAGYVSYLWSNGSTAAFIDVTNASAGTFTVTVTNAAGCSRTSAPVSVTNHAATAITAQPQNVTMPRNTTRTLSVGASGTATLQYQWYDGLSGDTSKPVGTNSSTLTVGPFSKKGTYRRWVRVWSSTCPSSAVNSQTATITVN